MKAKHLYLLLCVLGALIPYAAFVPWLAEHGLNIRLFVQELLANRISTFFGLDVVVSAVVVAVFTGIESRRAAIRFRWTIVPALLLVGVSLALPLLLYLREASANASSR